MTLARKIAVFVSLAALVTSSAGAIAPETPSLKPGKNLVAGRPGSGREC